MGNVDTTKGCTKCVVCGREYYMDSDGELIDGWHEGVPMSNIWDEPVCETCKNIYLSMTGMGGLNHEHSHK